MPRSVLFALPLAMLATASPAIAGEGRVEARTGYVETNLKFDDGSKIDTGNGADFGAAAGYDFDLGSKFFVGPEASVDFTTAERTIAGEKISFGRQFTLAARLGVKLGRNAKLYLLGGVANSKAKSAGLSDTGTGGLAALGLQYSVSNRVFVKAEYRYVTDRSDASDTVQGKFQDRRFLTGIGVRF